MCYVHAVCQNTGVQSSAMPVWQRKHNEIYFLTELAYNVSINARSRSSICCLHILNMLTCISDRDSIMYSDTANEKTASKKVISACKTQQHQGQFYMTVALVTINKKNNNAPAHSCALTLHANLTQPACLTTNQIKADKLSNTRLCRLPLLHVLPMSSLGKPSCHPSPGCAGSVLSQSPGTM